MTAPPAPSQDAEGAALARLFHETYERLAPSFKYETRVESAVPWERVPANNRALMVATCREVESAIRAPYEELVKAAHEIVTLGCLCITEQHHDRCPVVRMKAALESLGGRS